MIWECACRACTAARVPGEVRNRRPLSFDRNVRWSNDARESDRRIRRGRRPAGCRRLIAMQFLLRALTRVPLSVLYAFGGLMYFVAFHLMRWRRDRAEHDVFNAFPEKDPVERAAIVRRSYHNLADRLMESFWGVGARAEAIKKRVTIENAELVIDGVAAGRSVVLLTAHYGNWEWLSLAAGAHFGVTIDVVYQPQRVEAFDSFLREARGRFGSRFIPRKEFVFDLMSRADKSRISALTAAQTPKG